MIVAPSSSLGWNSRFELGFFRYDLHVSDYYLCPVIGYNIEILTGRTRPRNCSFPLMKDVFVLMSHVLT